VKSPGLARRLRRRRGNLFAVGQVDRRLQDETRGQLQRARDSVCSEISAGIRSGDEVPGGQYCGFAPQRPPIDRVPYRAGEVRR
jgi:hypothetical protein